MTGLDCVASLHLNLSQIKFCEGLGAKSTLLSAEIYPKMEENRPKISQFLPKSLQELPKIDPEGLLEAILDQYLIQARCQTLKNRVRSAQERPPEVHDHAKPLQNRAQETPQCSF